MAPYANGNGRLHSPKKGRDGLLRRNLVYYLLLPALMAMFVISLLVNQDESLAQRASFYHRKTFIDRSEPTQFQEPTEYNTDIPTTTLTIATTTIPTTKPFPTDNDDDDVLHKQQEQQQQHFPFENSTLPIDTDTSLEDIDIERHVDDETIFQDDDGNDTPIETTTTQPPSSSVIDENISSTPTTTTTTEDTNDPQAIIDSLQDSVALAALAAQQQQQQQQHTTDPSITLIDDINSSITGNDTPIITNHDTDGLFSNVAVEDAWWSNVIAKNGTVVPKIVHPPPIVTTIDMDTTTISSTTGGFNNSSSSGLVLGPPLSLSSSSTSKGRTDYHLRPSDVDPTFMKNCKIAVIDTAEIFGPMMSAPTCSLNNPAIWPFDDNSSSDSFLTDQSSTATSASNRPVHGIDGSPQLSPEEYQYSMEWWLTNGIRDSGRFTTDLEKAQFVYIDMHCYHVSWLTFMHPHHGIGGINKGAINPTPFLERSLQMMLDIPRFKLTKGADFGLARPSPSLRGLFREEALCEDLASVFSLVAEHSSLCVWTPDAALQGKAMVMPYLAVTDLPPPTGSDGEGDDAWDALTAERERFITFQGGCGTRDPAYRDMFYAGKMMRLSVVEELQKMQQEEGRREKEQQQGKEASSSSSSNNGSEIHAECACDICDGAVPHAQLMEIYRHTTFCPIIPSNVQSSRRLTEVILSGCIPVFMGPPFHTLPLGDHVDWEAAAVFLDITDTGPWINGTSSNWRHNKMINLAWKLDANIKRNQDTSNSGTSLLSSYDGMIKVANIKDSIALLKAMPIEAVRTKQQALAKIAPLFDYRPHPTDGTSSALVELVMDKMCTRAAEVEMRMKKAKEDGLLDGVGGRDGERVRKKDMKLFSYL